MIVDNPVFSEEIPDKGLTPGHLRFHLKQVDKNDIALVGFCANVTASLLFERLQAQGTNIIISLRKDAPHVDVIARTEEDGLNLVWPPKSIDATQLNDIAERIKGKTFLLGKETPKPTEVVLAPPKEQPKPEDMTEAEEDYLVKQLHRIP